MFTGGIADNPNDVQILELIQKRLGITVDEDEYAHDFRLYAGLYRHSQELGPIEELFTTLMRSIDDHVPTKNLIKLGEVSGSSMVKETHRAVQDSTLPSSGGLHGYRGEHRELVLRLAAEWGHEGLLILLCGADPDTRMASLGMSATAHLETASAAAIDMIKGRLLRQKKGAIQKKLQNLSEVVRGVDEREGDLRFSDLRLKLWKLDLMQMNPSELDFELSEMVRQYDREEDDLRRDPGHLDKSQLRSLVDQIAFIKALKACGGVTHLRYQLDGPGYADDATGQEGGSPYDWQSHNFCEAWLEEIETGDPWYADLDFGVEGAPF